MDCVLISMVVGVTLRPARATHFNESSTLERPIIVGTLQTIALTYRINKGVMQGEKKRGKQSY